MMMLSGGVKTASTPSAIRELAGAVAEMKACKGAYLLEVRVESEENVFPMVPAGAPVSAIRLE